MARFARLADWLVWLEGLHPKSIELGLERIGEVWARLGEPRLADRVVTVAGTNGKGSSVAMLDAILSAAGHKVGRFTSPHLLRFTERVVINGREVDEVAYCAALGRVDAARRDISLSYFEFTALAAFLCFADAGLDVALLEVGLGGRLDAVNVIDADIALITAIALDHQEWLGDDRELIGREKAGIMRPGVVTVCADPDPPVSIGQYAHAIGASLRQLGADFHYQEGDGSWDWRSGDGDLDALPLPALPGRFQLDNAAGVLAAVRALDPSIPRAAIENGLREVRWPGRWQLVGEHPQVVLDVAHNPHSAGGLASLLAADPMPRTLAVFGMLRTKDVAGVLGAVAAHVDAWYLAGLPPPLGLAVSELRAHLDTFGVVGSVANCDNVADALQAARAAAGPEDRIVVFGSFVTVEHAMRALQAS
ncbi:MAG: bifunctional tetrahydrofolate synthase/dihydrofolate synthase [Chromatiales bacterium]|nr:bifunctional tetrahydrofolate synthase/dihydrofolate synthase [Gammaproteobacteria bacterium]MCP5352083.1 bifunctional tetrahydrofolate synthase/dihydrofolate synthase [Chromatiales bacterium]